MDTNDDCPNTLCFDEIGYWTEIKLDIVRDYAREYSKILAKQDRLSHAYIDGFAGSGVHLVKNTQEFVLGSPLNALQIQPPFRAYFLQQYKLFGGENDIKLHNKQVVDAFRQRLKQVAGFKYVPESIPMCNSTNAVVYYLFFASHKPVATRIIQYIFDKYKNRRSSPCARTTWATSKRGSPSGTTVSARHQPNSLAAGVPRRSSGLLTQPMCSTLMCA